MMSKKRGALLAEEQRGRLSHMNEVKNQSQRKFQEEKERETDLMKKSNLMMNQIKDVATDLVQLYDNKDKTAHRSCFFSRLPTDEYFQSEEAFTSALTGYTRKQFFDGIGELAGSRGDSLRYELLETSQAESMLITGQAESVTKNECEELTRLQSVYSRSVLQELDSKLGLAGVQAAVETAKMQLRQVQNTNWLEQQKRVDVNVNVKIETLQRSVREKQEELNRLCAEDISLLVRELQQVSGSMILTGNYDLKIARQDYFISKQEEVIKQLLLQNSRHRLLSMLCEVDVKAQQNTYHLLSSIRSLLDGEVAAMERRIACLTDPLIRLDDAAARETIDSQDSFALALHEVFVRSDQNEHTSLYKTFDSLRDAVTVDTRGRETRETQTTEREVEVDRMLKLLEEEVEKCTTQMREGAEADDGGTVDALIEKISTKLSSAEREVNNVVKDVVAKRKLLETDPFSSMERTIFTNFMNDPARLKRNLNELKGRVDALG